MRRVCKVKAFAVGNYNQEHPTIKMQFTNLGACVGLDATSGGTIPTGQFFTDLVAELAKEVPPAQVKVKVDIDQPRPASGEETGPFTLPRHLLLVNYDYTYIRLGSSWGPSFLDATVLWERPDAFTDRFTFTGPVWVWDSSGGAKDWGGVSCPGPNKVVATLVRHTL